MNYKKYLLAYAFLFMGLVSFSQYEVQFDLTTDQYPGETSFTLMMGSDEIDSEDDFNDANTEYPTVTWDLAEGTYTFTIEDSYGDGICCGFGDGSFTVTDVTTGQTIATGGDFGDEFSVTFSQPYVPPVMGCTNEMAWNYNPDAESDDGSCILEGGQPVIELEEVAVGYDAPVDITNAGDNRLFIVEQDGLIQIMDSAYNDAGTLIDISSSVASGGERGLLGLAFDPMYSDNGHFFVNYTKNNGDSRISRFTVDMETNTADPSTELVILEQDQPYANHNAGDLAFGPDGFLYIPFGDGGSGEDPLDAGQSTDTWLGKMLRIDVSEASEDTPYTIPESNPFIDNDDYLPEIWATGLRNTWRIGFDAMTGDLWMGDVGQYTWEEIDVEPAGDPGGRNYGWRCYEGNHEFNTSGCASEDVMTWPVFEYNHSGGACSVTGGFVYRGEEYNSLDGVYICTDYCSGIFYGIRWEEDEYVSYEMLAPQGFGWTTFGQSNDYDMYVANSNGSIHKITDPCGDFTAEITISGDSLIASEGEVFAWSVDGQIDFDATNQNYNPDSGSSFQVGIINEDGCSAISDPIDFNAVTEVSKEELLDIYPNPVDDVLTIELPQSNEVYLMTIYDAQGRIVKSWKTRDSIQQIDVNELSAGNYLIQVSYGQENITKSFVKK